MLLRHLSLSAQAGDTAAAVAVAFTVCRMFFEEVRVCRRTQVMQHADILLCVLACCLRLW